MRLACTSGIMETNRGVRTLRATGNEEDDYAYVRGARELDRAGIKNVKETMERTDEGNRTREEAWVPSSSKPTGRWGPTTWSPFSSRRTTRP